MIGNWVLPPVRPGIPEMLVVTYKDGSVLRVPYFDHSGTVSFLSLEDDIKEVEIVPYLGE